MMIPASDMILQEIQMIEGIFTESMPIAKKMIGIKPKMMSINRQIRYSPAGIFISFARTVMEMIATVKVHGMAKVTDHPYQPVTKSQITLNTQIKTAWYVIFWGRLFR